MKQASLQQPTGAHHIEHIIIGTAGHIDHGKTSLVKALTGIDTDRLPEEKKRGLTIDLGFAYLDLNENRRVSIVDVPGHERFVKNMLAGATSINLVIFVVAADDGIMPQTIEHLEIINLLGIRHGIIALTKKDLVTDEWLAVVQEDIKKTVTGTSLELAPIIPVSVVTGEGIETCETAIRELIARAQTQSSRRVFRMPIDRSFTIPGYGCVVTGPVLGGQIAVEDEIELLPTKKALRVRGIEVTGERVTSAFAGQRAALNLAGVKSAEIQRGYELSVPGYLQPASAIDALLRLIKSAKTVLKNRARIRFYLNTAEVMGRVVLLDRDALKPGEEVLCQVLLEDLITTEREDRFIIRSYSPAYTIGGGKVLRYNTTRLKRFQEKTIKTLKILASGNLPDIVEQVYLNNIHVCRDERPFAPTVDDVSRQVNIHPSTAEDAIAGLVKKGLLLKFLVEGKDIVVHRDVIAAVKEQILSTLKAFHKENPVKTGIEESQLRTSVATGLLPALKKVKARAGESRPKSISGEELHPFLFTAALSVLKNEKAIKITDNKLSLMDFRLEVSARDKGAADKIEEAFLKAGFTPPFAEEVVTKFGASGKAAISLLAEQKKLIMIENGLYFHATILNKIKELVRDHVAKNGPMSVAQFRDLIRTTRKYAVPLLEYLDAIHFTKRTGDVRIVL
ncbi:MAG: selenocysteine-specific translation elongation factor [Candidatus Brocadia sp.]|nr:selenocysteine-specific translation elongation factor [Candidatus Brocadia sp.]MCE7912572.1 selenocysteine-specific translation elongation factor [Candidatus Brocadia sp. AMX3]MDG5997988.1 selenocysteine-specific translation elongation factor [Candidatus Brocadia sp.]RIJ95211.1 MAG: selenocysteine-specific translation elongation factor [Candidatus Brocadia sp.]